MGWCKKPFHVYLHCSMISLRQRLPQLAECHRKDDLGSEIEVSLEADDAPLVVPIHPSFVTADLFISSGDRRHRGGVWSLDIDRPSTSCFLLKNNKKQAKKNITLPHYRWFISHSKDERVDEVEDGYRFLRCGHRPIGNGTYLISDHYKYQ
jgi:hypothetical protein